MGADARPLSAADRGRAVRPGRDPAGGRGRGRRRRMSRARRCCGRARTAMLSSRTAATGSSMPRCSRIADPQIACRPAVGHPGRRRARALHRARASRHTRRPGRRSRRRAVVTATTRVHKESRHHDRPSHCPRPWCSRRALSALAHGSQARSAQHSAQPGRQPAASAAAIALAKQLLELKGGIGAFDPVIVGVIEQHQGNLLQINPNLTRDIDATAQTSCAHELAPRRQELRDEIARGLCERVHRAGAQGAARVLQDAARQEDDRAGAARPSRHPPSARRHGSTNSPRK